MNTAPDAHNPTAPSHTRIALAQLEALLAQVFARHGTSPSVAAALAHNCALADQFGVAISQQDLAALQALAVA